MFLLKGEIRAKSKQITCEREKYSKQNAAKIILKNGIRTKEVLTFKNFSYFGKYFLTSPLEYSTRWGDVVIPSQFVT